jgi:hypothetical protein
MANQACISIGINQYQFLPPLGYGLADAVAIKQFFVDSAGWNQSQCLLLTDTSPDSRDRSTYPDLENIQRWLKQWAWDTLRPGDLLWFFFSGCGVSFEGEDYLIPIDGNVQDLPNTCISIRQLYQQFHDIGVNPLVFIDANRSQHLAFGDGIGNVTAKLAQDYQIPTFLSCQSQELSHEEAGLGHGLFTRALLEALNYHPDLNLDTIDTYLTSRLAELSEHHWKPLQTPMAIIPNGVSGYRPVFSSTTQSSVSATIPEAIYTPPTPASFNQNDSYAAYTPPNVFIVRPETLGASAIVKRSRQTPRRKQVPHWARVGFLLALVVAAGGAIYAFTRSPDTNQEPSATSGIVSGITTPIASTAIITADSQEVTLAQAKEKVKRGDATSRYVAILTARKIPTTTPEAAVEVQKSIELWSQEIYLISSSYARRQQWQLAIDTAKMVPPDATNYATAQASMSIWRQKL